MSGRSWTAGPAASGGPSVRRCGRSGGRRRCVGGRFGRYRPVLGARLGAHSPHAGSRPHPRGSSAIAEQLHPGASRPGFTRRRSSRAHGHHRPGSARRGGALVPSMSGSDANAQRESSSRPSCTSHTSTASPRTSTAGKPGGRCPTPARSAAWTVAHPPPMPGQDQQATAGKKPAETPVTGCCGGDGRLVTDVPRCVVEYRFRLGVHGGGLRAAAKPSRARLRPRRSSRRSVPIGRCSVGVDARVDAASSTAAGALAAAGDPSILA